MAGEHVRLEVDLVARGQAPSVVTARVCGTSATEKERSPRPTMVMLTPSIAIEPFSTQ